MNNEEFERDSNELPYWIIDGYYFQVDLKNDKYVIMKKDGEELIGIDDEKEYNEVLTRFKSKLYGSYKDQIWVKF